MRGGKKARGFTLIETMIVLAVTGGLFLAIAASLAGKQQRTQFEQAVNDIQSRMQQAINDVAVGFYPGSNTFTCSATAGGPSFSAGTTAQGANTGCIFVGKAIQFDVSGTSDPESINLYTIAGLRLNPVTSRQVDSYVSARPEVVTAVTERQTLQYGINTLWVRYTGSAADAGIIAFTNSLSSYSGTGTLVSGAQHVRLLPIKGGNKNMNETAARTAIRNYMRGTSGATPDTDVDPSSGVTICFTSGGTNQSALMTIGSNNRQLSVNVQIKPDGNVTCA